MSSKPIFTQPFPTSSSGRKFSISIDIPTTPHDNSLYLEHQTRICPICTEDYPLNEIQTPLSCKHSFCSSCLKQYLTVKIHSNQILNISCPQSGFQEIFTSNVLEGVLEPEIYTKYRELVLKKIVLKNFQKNLCPNPTCTRQFLPSQTKNTLIVHVEPRYVISV